MLEAIHTVKKNLREAEASPMDMVKAIMVLRNVKGIANTDQKEAEVSPMRLE